MARQEIPGGYFSLREAFDLYGRHLFKEAWTGQELGADISDMNEDVRETGLGTLPGPAPRPSSNTEPGKRRDEAEYQFRRIMYARELQAFSFNIIDGELTPFPSKHWLARLCSLSMEYSIAVWFDIPDSEYRRGIIVIDRKKLTDFLNKGGEVINTGNTQESELVRGKIESMEASGLINEARSKGGSRSKYNDALEQAIIRVGDDLTREKKSLTTKSFKNWIDKNSSPDLPFSFEPIIPDCDCLYLDDQKLVWRDETGLKHRMSLRSLEPYFRKIKARS